MWFRLIAAALALVVSAAPSDTPSDTFGGVDLGGVFGRARASGIELSGATMELDLEVEADPEAVVVSHLIEPGGEQKTVPLVARSSGVFGIRTEVRKIDYVVVFEVVGGLAAQSQPVRLTELGIQPGLLGIVPPTTRTDDFDSATTQWGWAGLGFAAAALAVLAYWALPDRRRQIEDSSPDQGINLSGPDLP